MSDASCPQPRLATLQRDAFGCLRELLGPEVDGRLFALVAEHEGHGKVRLRQAPIADRGPQRLGERSDGAT